VAKPPRPDQKVRIHRTPSARALAAIIRTLAPLLRDDAPPADATVAATLKAFNLGPAEREDLIQTVRAVIARRAQLNWWVARSMPGAVMDEPSSLLAASLVLEAHVEGDGLISRGRDLRREFDIDTYAWDTLVPALRGKTLDHPTQPRAVRLNMPAWLEHHFLASFGRDWEKEAAALSERPVVHLRVNTLKTERDDAIAALKKNDIKAFAAPYSPMGLRVPEPSDVAGSKPFHDGLVEFQDEGAQLASLLCDARPGQRVIDYCAGAGGKSLALAAIMANRGTIIACDPAENRLARAQLRFKRAGATIVERRVLDAAGRKRIKRAAETFDRALVDVPCTGTGAWRRNPDAKWKSKPENLANLITAQRDIVARAARLVKPGGRLIYVTCSMLDDENGKQIERFLESNKEFSALDAPSLWTSIIGKAPPDNARQGAFIRLTPRHHGTDGFFIAVLERAAKRREPKPGSEPATPQ